MIKLYKLLLPLFIIAFLVGCATERQYNSSIQNDVSYNERGNENNNVRNLNIVGAWSGPDVYAATSDGLFQLSAPQGTRINIMYSDINTGQQLYLCNRPDCQHNSDSCTSVIDVNKGAVPGLGCAGDKLLLIKQHAARDGKAGIVLMELDGSNRKTLFELPANESMPGTFYTDGEHLFFIRDILKGNTSQYSVLSSVELNSGKVKDILTFKENENWKIMGFSSNKIVAVKTEGLENLMAGKAETSDIQYEAWIIDFDSPALDNSALKWTYNEMDAIMHEGNLYGYDKQNIAFKKIDLMSGKTQVVEYDRNRPEPYVVFMFAGEIDGMLMAEIGDGEGNLDRLLINFDKNTTTGLSLSTDGVKEAPLPILAKYESQLLVITGYKEVSYVDIDIDGNPFETTALIENLALISKEDYFMNIPNYTYIQSVFS